MNVIGAKTVPAFTDKEEKMKFHRSPIRTLLVFVLILGLLVPAFAAGAAGTAQNIKTKQWSNFNVGLVIDGSASLGNAGSSSTDPDGMRYEALDLFLALLTERGNYVDTIVFNDNKAGYLLNTGVQPIDSREAKLELSRQIRATGSVGDTDIGGSLLEAVDALQKASDQNGLKPVVILFSDGRTDLGDDKEAYEQSLENKEKAIELAQEAGIPVYTICLAASDFADPAELQEIAERTSGEYIVVDEAEELSDAFESFYQLIFASSCKNRISAAFDAEGKFDYDFKIPHYGAEEVNVIMDTDEIKDVHMTLPAAEWDKAALENTSMSGGKYNVIKFVDPESGDWVLHLAGEPGSEVLVNVLYTLNANAFLGTEDGLTDKNGSADYELGADTTLVTWIYEDGKQITDPLVADEYLASVTLVNQADGSKRTEPMTPNANGSFSYTVKGDPAKKITYRATAHLETAGISMDTNTVTLNMGSKPPAIVEPPEKEERTLTLEDGEPVVKDTVTVTIFRNHSKTYDLSKWFNYDGEDELKYEIVSSQLVPDTAKLDGHDLKINTLKSKSGNVLLKASNENGAFVEVTLRLKVINLIPAIGGLTFALIAAGIVILLAGFYARTHLIFRGNVEVRNLETGSHGTSPASFRGKLILRRFMVGDTGFDQKKAYFYPTGRNRLEFRYGTGFYMREYRDMLKKKDISSGTYVIFSDQAMTRGIEVRVNPDRNAAVREPRGGRGDVRGGSRGGRTAGSSAGRAGNASGRAAQDRSRDRYAGRGR